MRQASALVALPAVRVATRPLVALLQSTVTITTAAQTSVRGVPSTANNAASSVCVGNLIAVPGAATVAVAAIASTGTGTAAGAAAAAPADNTGTRIMSRMSRGYHAIGNLGTDTAPHKHPMASHPTRQCHAAADRDCRPLSVGDLKRYTSKSAAPGGHSSEA